MNETLQSLAALLNVEVAQLGKAFTQLAETDHRYLKDIKVNVSNALGYATLSKKESYLLALSVASNQGKQIFVEAFTSLAKKEGATDADVAETLACVSLLNINNVFYRFRHFAKKEFYSTTPAGIKMNIMLSPVLGKEFFELMSLAVSALNGCEMCVGSHEESLMKLGTSQQRVYDAMRLTSIVKGFLVITD